MLFWLSPQLYFFLLLWELSSFFPALSATLTLYTSITPKVRDGSTADTRREKRTHIRDLSQRGKGRGATLRASSQSMMPALEAFSILEREILESTAGCQGKLKIDGTGEKL